MMTKVAKTSTLHIRCTVTELSRWEKAAEDAGAESLSEWVRKWLLHASERDVRNRLITS